MGVDGEQHLTELFPEVAAAADLEAEISCVERELGFRRRCYPRWLENGKITKALADREIELMERVLRRLQAQRGTL